MFIAEDVTQIIGETPLLRLSRLFPGSPADILAKLELCNPTSIKDRAVLNMVSKAIERGEIKLTDGDFPGTEVVEATSGNTGIALAAPDHFGSPINKANKSLGRPHKGR